MWIYPRMNNCIEAQSVGIFGFGVGCLLARGCIPFSSGMDPFSCMGIKDCL